MATTFTGLRVQDTYNAILKIGDNTNLTGTAKLLSDGFGNSSAIYLSTTSIGIGVTPSYQLHTSGNAKIGGNLIISGNLTVNGTLTYLNVIDLEVKDPLIKLATDNTANSLDIGFFGKYVSTGTRYKGLFNDASDDKFKLFLGTTIEPGTTVNTSGNGYTIGTLVANLEGNVTGGTISGTTGSFSGLVTGIAPTSALNFATKKYVDDSIPVIPGTPALSAVLAVGNTSGANNLKMADTKKILLGDDDDVEFFSNSAGYLINKTGNLYIENLANDRDISFICSDGNNGSSVYLFMDGSVQRNKFFQNTQINDNVTLGVGSDLDLNFKHDGTDSYIRNIKGNLNIYSDVDDGDITFNLDNGANPAVATVYMRLDGGDENIVFAKPISGTTGAFSGLVTGIAPTADLNFATKKYVDDNIPTITTPALSAVLAVGNTSGSNNLIIQDDDELILGSGTDFKLYHNQTNTLVRVNTGDLIFNSFVADGDIKFNLDNGADPSAPTEYMRFDGGIVKTLFSKPVVITNNTSPTLQILDTNNSVNLQLIATDVNVVIGSYSAHPLIFVQNTGTVLTIDTSKNATFIGDVGLGGTGLYTTSHSLNIDGTGLAIKNNVNGSSNNWSHITNSDTASSSNLVFTTGSAIALTLAHNTNATFGGRASLTDSIDIRYTGSKDNDAAIYVVNDSSDWGMHINKGATNYGIRITTEGGQAFGIYNSAGVNKVLFTGAGNGTFAGTVNATGNVNIATPITNDFFGLSLQYNSADTAVFYVNQATGQVKIGGTATGYYPTFYSGNVERLKIDASGVSSFYGNINIPGTDNSYLINGYQLANWSYFGYSTGYPGIVIGNTGQQSLFFNVDPVGNPSGSFTGDGREYVYRNVGSFITPNATNNGYNTILGWNTSGGVTFSSGSTFNGDVTITGNLFLPTASSYIKLGGYSFIGEDLIDNDSLTIASHYTESIYFAHENAGVYSSNMRIDPSGNVGIGANAVTNPGFWYDAINKYLAISHWATPPTPAALLHLSDNANDIDVPQIRIEGRENVGDTKLDISVKDPNIRFNLIENTPDANAGYGLMIFKTNSVANASFPTRGGFNFQTPAATSSLFITNQAKIGIGTSIPSAKLEVNVASGDGILIKSTDVATLKMKGSGSVYNWGLATTNLTGGDFGMYKSNAVGGDPISAGTAQLYFKNLTNNLTQLGIGCSATDVDGRVDIRMNFLNQSWVPNNTSAKWSEVWCNTGTPGTYFNDVMLHLNTNRAGGTTGGVVGIAFSPGWGGHQNWGIYSFNTTGGGYTSGDLSFVSQLNDSTRIERMRLDGPTGHVGIGNFSNAPSAKLHVDNGSLYVNAIRSNTKLSGSVSSDTSANLYGSQGYWGIRTSLDNSINFDTYNSGSQITPLTIEQGGIVYIHGTNNGNDGTLRVGARGYFQHRDGGNTITSIISDYSSDSAVLNFRMKGVSDANAQMTMKGSGNIGVNTTNPSAKLHTVDDGYSLKTSRTTGASENLLIGNKAAAGIIGTTHPGQIVSSGNNIFEMYTEGAQPLVLGTASTHRIYISATGRVGLGTTSPSGKLDVTQSYSASLRVGYFQSSAYSSPQVTYDTFTINQQDVPSLILVETPTASVSSHQKLAITVGDNNAVFRTSNVSGGMWFNVNGNVSSPGYQTTIGTNAIRILNNADVGIGTPTPTEKLSVRGANQSVEEILRVRTGNGSYSDAGASLGVSGYEGEICVYDSANVKRIYLSSHYNCYINPKGAGLTAIGKTSASYTLDVDGTIRATSDIIAFSDRRVKENIVTIDNALNKVTKLRGVKYTRKDIEDKTTKIGVIAQEVLEVLPEVVKKDDQGKYSVAYGNIAGVFIEAIKELKLEVDILKQEIKELKN